ncbi:MAG: CDP-diacylglycerol--glycerol-3-phosphate 3-phosphatidyltransferase [Candidatus Omnitrophica bacterium]|nr:CDP-diacylglycerol--glycerol-3-phosphate 3-phosphatidyltransferase [Candidatus Omnitrophota bacterium]
MNVPNILTISRILLTLLFAALTQMHGADAAWAALVVFGVAALTDLVDGYVARRFNLITTFGKIMDPVADKFLTLTALFIVAFEGTIGIWMVVLVALREISVTVVRIFALTRGWVIPAESAGKVKAGFQMATVALALGYRALLAGGPAQGFVRNHQISLSCIVNGFMIVVIILTLWSGFEFFNKLMLQADKK